MVRTTRNSQRAASEVVQIPPSASRPVSPYDPNSQPVPFPTVDDRAFEAQEQPATHRRRSARQALSVITDAPTASPVSVSAANHSKTPSHTPFRRPPTGSMANRLVLGDLMSPPPQAPTPVEAASADEEEGAENDENSTPSHLVPVPYSPKNDEDKHLKSTNAYDPFWKCKRRPVHRAQLQQPDHWEEVGYYQENEWDTDAEEYTPRPPRQRRLRNKPPQTDRDPAVLFEGESFQRNFKKLRPKTWKPFANKYVKSKLGFAPLNEGKKLKLVDDNGKAQYWQGVRTPTKPDTTPYWQGLIDAMEARVYRLPEDDEVDFDENGDLLPNPDIHPSTGLPTAEWLEDQVNELAFEAKMAEQEFKLLQGGKAELWGSLMMENEELEEDNREMFALLKRVKRIVPPHVFKQLVFLMDRTDMDDPQNVYGPAKKIPYEDSSTDVGDEGTDSEGGDTDNGDDDEGGDDENSAPRTLTRGRNPNASALADMIAQAQSTPHPANTKTDPKASGGENSNTLAESTTHVQSQSQPTAPPTTTSNQANHVCKPRPLARATVADKHAWANALAQQQPAPAPSTSTANNNAGPIQQPKATAGPSRTPESNEGGDETDAEGTDSEDDADEENKPRTAGFQVYRDPSSPQSENNDGDADDENESPLQPRKFVEPKKENEARVFADDDFDDIYADEEGTWNPTPPQAQGKGKGVSKEEEVGDPQVSDEGAEVKPVVAAASQVTTAFQVYVDEPVAGQTDAEEKRSAPKCPPLGPKRMPSFLSTFSLKRGRDESDEGSEHGDQENDENENSWVPSKKRRVSGSYGAHDENTPVVVSAPQAETDHYNEYETEEPSENRPLSPISERPTSEEREDEEIEELLSYIESSPGGSPEPTGETSISAHLDWRGNNDVEMSDASDEENDENAAPVLPAPVPLPAPVLAPLLPSPVIVSTRVRRDRTLMDMGGASGSQQSADGQASRPKRPLKRSETMWLGD